MFRISIVGAHALDTLVVCYPLRPGTSWSHIPCLSRRIGEPLAFPGTLDTHLAHIAISNCIIGLSFGILSFCKLILHYLVIFLHHLSRLC